MQEIELPEEFGRISEWHKRVCNGEGRSSFLGSMSACWLLRSSVYLKYTSLTSLDYLLAKDKLDPLIQGQVENTSNLTRKAQLEAYDGCAKLRPVWDDIASKFDAVLTPSVPDEAPIGINSTGDAVYIYPPFSPPIPRYPFPSTDPSSPFAPCGQSSTSLP